jgi:DNA-binding response OmpR family regulator
VSGQRISGVRGKRILVVQDEPLLALEVARALTDVGYLVTGPTGTAAEVMGLIGNTQIDGALLDARLIAPTADQVASTLIRRKVPFAVLTAYAGETVPAACRGAPMLAKPFTEEQLLATVRRLFATPTTSRRG